MFHKHNCDLLFISRDRFVCNQVSRVAWCKSGQRSNNGKEHYSLFGRIGQCAVVPYSQASSRSKCVRGLICLAFIKGGLDNVRLRQ